jgi:hypothetical protein
MQSEDATNLACFWNILTKESKSGLDHSGPESKELSKIAVGIFGGKSTRFLPIPKASPIMVGTTAHGEDESAKNYAQDNDYFEGGEPELQLAEELHTKVVDHDDCHHKDGNPYARTDVFC